MSEDSVLGIPTLEVGRMRRIQEGRMRRIQERRLRRKATEIEREGCVLEVKLRRYFKKEDNQLRPRVAL